MSKSDEKRLESLKVLSNWNEEELDGFAAGYLLQENPKTIGAHAQREMFLHGLRAALKFIND
jgi:hypothetical protein